MARAVGLDVGANHVRIVEADGGARGLRVIRLGEREIVCPEGGDREDAVREAVDALFRDTRASRDEVVMTWPAEACVLREIQVPFREPDQIRKVVKFEFETHLHGRDVEEVVVDYLVTGENPEGTRLLCAGADKPPLRARLRALEKVKVDPVAVDLDATALVAALAATGVLLETPTAVVVDVGSRSTRVVLLVDGRVRSIRAYRGGVDSLAAGLEADLGSGAAARGLEEGARPDDLLALPAASAAPDAPPAERSAASLEVAVAEDRRSDYLARLGREVGRTLAQTASAVPFPVAWITGRGSLVPGVRETIADRLGIETRPLDLFRRTQSPVPPEMLEETDASYSTALGAVARALGVDVALVDLRREDLGYARRFDQVKGALAVALGLLLLGVGFLLWRAKAEKEAALTEYNRMNSQLETKAGRVEATYKADLGEEEFGKLHKGSGDPLRSVADRQRRAGQMQTHLEIEMGLSTDVPPITSSLEVFREVHRAILQVREKLEYCLVTTENYNQRGADLTLVLSAPEHVDLVRAALLEIQIDKSLRGGGDGKEPLFAEVSPGSVAKGRDGRYTVPFTCTFPKESVR